MSKESILAATVGSFPQIKLDVFFFGTKRGNWKVGRSNVLNVTYIIRSHPQQVSTSTLSESLLLLFTSTERKSD